MYVGSTLTGLSGYAQAAAIVTDITWETTSTIQTWASTSRCSATGCRSRPTGTTRRRATCSCRFPSPRSWDFRTPMTTSATCIPKAGRSPSAGATTSAISATDSRSTFRTTFRRWVTSATRRSSRTARSSARARNTNRGTATSARASTRPRRGCEFGDHGFLRLPGDIRYRNFGDGDPNNPLISTDYDRRVLGSSLPHFNYGGSVDLAWRGIDFNLTFQGVGQRNSYLTDEMVQPLRRSVV